MEILNPILNVTLLPTTVLLLIFIAPALAAIRAIAWFFSIFFPSSIDGKVVVITGASSGIGRAAAVEYAKKGARLVLAGRREEDLRHTAAMCRREGVDARVCTTDVSKKEECHELIRFTMETFGRIDHVYNNAGITHSSYMEEVQSTDVAQVMDVSFWGCVYPTLYALPHLRRTNGRIVVTASIAAFVPYPRMAVYNAAKAALLNFYETLRVEIGDEVGVTIALPGWVESEMTAGKFVTAEGKVDWSKEQRDRHVGPSPVEPTQSAAAAIVNAALRGQRSIFIPSWYTTVLYYRVFAPDVVERFLRVMYTAPRGSEPFSKMAVQSGADALLYPSSIQKSH